MYKNMLLFLVGIMCSLKAMDDDKSQDSHDTQSQKQRCVLFNRLANYETACLRDVYLLDTLAPTLVQDYTSIKIIGTHNGNGGTEPQVLSKSSTARKAFRKSNFKKSATRMVSNLKFDK